LDTGLSALLRRNCLIAKSYALLYPGFHFLSDPRHPALPELYPDGKVSSKFQTAYVHEGIGHTVDTLEFALSYELHGHHNNSSERSVATPG
jgi:hypothetical protein